MVNNSKLTVLLGSGFSANAGYPVGRILNEKFNSTLIDKLFNSYSNTWRWINENDFEQELTQTSNESFIYSYILNELVLCFKKNATFENYEVFYHYVKTICLNDSQIKEICTNAMNKFSEQFPNQDSCLEINYKKIPEIFDYLIADLLKLRTYSYVQYENYIPFIELLKTYEKVDIFTLNHDLLLEELLERNSIKYSKGFSTTQSELISNSKTLNVFNNDFTESKINIYKLHGSIDLYAFLECEQKGTLLIPTDNEIYFLADNEDDFQFTKRINPITKEEIQSFNPYISPRFITGCDKLDIIKKDYMYSKLYCSFVDNIKDANTIVISGYSFGDEHINQIIKKNSAQTIINHNISSNYPFCQCSSYFNTFKEVKDFLIN